MAFKENTLVLVFAVGLLQVAVTVSQAVETKGTSKGAINAISNVASNETSNLASNVTSNVSSISVSDINQGNVSSGNISDVVGAESLSAEEVLVGTPVMSDCVNDTAETSECMSRMLNLTLECANQTGASQDDVDIAMRMEIPSSDTGKCLTRCLLKRRGVMSSEGLFSPKATVEYLTEVHMNESLQLEFQKMADYCFGKLKLLPISSLDTCQFAYDIATCTEEYQKTLFLRNPAMAPPINAITTP